MYCDVCRKAGPDFTGKTEFVTGKEKFKRESLKHEKCFNMVSAKAHSSQTLNVSEIKMVKGR
jgi:hypothetical protein